ncbi:MAG: 2-C-methyl-D-erythritol 4-phosphate cytidylyltransferase [Deltaproteobacteria bacterium]|nr:2-C-methyl-D-erythritol 4-phosphate cytidylyltransferase [Deltaproteobacteria bacterium]
MHKVSFDLIILSAGRGKRFGGVNKGLLKIGNKSFIENELDIICSEFLPANVVITYHPSFLKNLKKTISGHPLNDRIAFVKGGSERALSVYNALMYLRKSNSKLVLIHDAARPNITPELIGRGIRTALKYGSAIPAVPLTDTIKLVRNNKIIKTVPRDEIYYVQTPQFFHKELITYAYSRWFEEKNDFIPTDDASLLEYSGISPVIIEGERQNIKVTYKDDMDIIKSDKTMRIGFGYDIHRIKRGGNLWLGGVMIDNSRSAIAHSDGDVLIHSICDGLLGACGLRDIGFYFPNSDKRFKDISSLKILGKTCNIISENGFKIVNIDSTVILQSPKIGKYIDEMKKNISKVLRISDSDIAIKATTPERTGEAGRGKAFSAYSVVLLSK